ncbi:hypothetical protein [Glycomyces dulcitolivorans]|nr:hypothetical protein [Glycomyces dulcitolivorans]
MSEDDRSRFSFMTCGWIGLIYAAVVFAATLAFVIWLWVNLDFPD